MDIPSLAPCNTTSSSFGIFSTLVSGLIIKIFTEQCKLDDSNQYPMGSGLPENIPAYDFIIIGGGTSGAVLANRLSTNKNWNVLVINKLGAPSVHSNIPALSTVHSIDGTVYFPQREQFSSQAFIDNTVILNKGYSLGGGTVIDDMGHYIANYLDFEKLQSSDGFKSFAFDDVLNYYSYSVKDVNDPTSIGYINVETVKATQGSQAILDAAKDIGLYNSNINPYNQIGLSEATVVRKNGERQNSAKAFINPIYKERRNLFILNNAEVVRIKTRFNSAKGVEVLINGYSYEIRVKHEIISTAGCISSPHMLLLSGIGPQRTLENAGISLVHELPVGQFMKDYSTTFVFAYSLPYYVPKVTHESSTFEYLMNRAGPLTNPNPDITGFVNSLNSELNIPNFQIKSKIFEKQSNLLAPFLSQWHFGFEFESILKQENQFNAILIFLPVHSNSSSTGNLEVKSPDIRDSPSINLNLLEKNEDMDAFLGLVPFFEKLTNTDSMRNLGTRLIITAPNCVPEGEDVFTGSKYWDCAIRNSYTTTSEQVGTCRMGHVVDENFRVIGIDGLRVVDSSVLPSQLTTSSSASSMMLAEKAAVDIGKSLGVDLMAYERRRVELLSNYGTDQTTVPTSEEVIRPVYRPDFMMYPQYPVFPFGFGSIRHGNFDSMVGQDEEVQKKCANYPYYR